MSRNIAFDPTDLSPASVDKLSFEDNVPNSRVNLVKTALFCEDPSRAVHSQADETDINRMVAGLTPFTSSARSPFFINEADFPEHLEDHVSDLRQAESAFMELPPAVREAFGNDPRELAKALGDPSQQARLAELGLIPGEEPQQPTQLSGGDSPPAKAGKTPPKQGGSQSEAQATD